MNVGGRPSVECQLVLGLVGGWLCSATSVQYFAQETSPPPSLPNEGREPTERGSVDRMIEPVGDYDVVGDDSDYCGHGGHGGQGGQARPGWLAGMDMDLTEGIVLYPGRGTYLYCAVLCCAALRGGVEGGLACRG